MLVILCRRGVKYKFGGLFNTTKFQLLPEKPKWQTPLPERTEQFWITCSIFRHLVRLGFSPSLFRSPRSALKISSKVPYSHHVFIPENLRFSSRFCSKVWHWNLEAHWCLVESAAFRRVRRNDYSLTLEIHYWLELGIKLQEFPATWWIFRATAFRTTTSNPSEFHYLDF